MARRFSFTSSWRRRESFSPLALAVALVLVVAVVFAASNCELGGMKSAGPAEHACCADPGADSSAPAYSACCTAMVGSLNVATAVPALHLVELFSAGWPEAAVAVIGERAGVGATAWSHAPPPPGTSSYFLEMGLSRSRPAHAPPFVVA